MNHYQDISVRRVIAGARRRPGLAGGRRRRPIETVDLVDLGTGERHRVPRARGFRGDAPAPDPRARLSPGYVLNPAVVPVHDPA